MSVSQHAARWVTAPLSWPRGGASWSGGEPEYEHVYHAAARAYRTDGWPMPYAEAEQQPDEDDTDKGVPSTG